MTFILFYRYQIGQTIVRQETRPSSDGAHKPDIPYVGIIVCPSYDSAYKEEKLKHYGLSKHEYRNRARYTPNSHFLTTGNLHDVFDEITYDLNDILHQVSITTMPNMQKVNFDEHFPSSLNSTKHIFITTKYWSSFGKCYSIRPKNHIVRRRIVLLTIIARMDIFVYFGHPGQFSYNTDTKVFISISLYNDIIYFLIRNA